MGSIPILSKEDFNPPHPKSTSRPQKYGGKMHPCKVSPFF